MVDRIDPQTPSGFRDYLPEDARARKMMMDRIAAVFEQFGYAPIDTPAMERLEVLTGGDEGFSKQIYRARLTDEDAPLGLRFDLTVPLARFVAAHASDLRMPFKRFHIGNVWRGEHTQAGRFRQFVQCDADIIGADSGSADAETIALAYAVYDALGLGERISIRLSDRRVMQGLVDFLGFDAKRLPAVMRAIDKLDKQQWEPVAAELAALGLDTQQVDGIQELLALRDNDPLKFLDKADAYLKFTPVSHEGLEALRALVADIRALGVPDRAFAIDLSIARGLGYYTGMVFEVALSGMPQFGSVGSGGRYDNLVSRFSPLQLDGVGMSVGIDRLFAALDELGLVPKTAVTAKIALLDFEKSARPTVMALAAQLRRAGIATELYIGREETLKGQLAWAVKGGFPFVAIMGAKEKEAGVVQLKDMAARTQQEVPVASVAALLQG